MISDSILQGDDTSHTTKPIVEGIDLGVRFVDDFVDFHVQLAILISQGFGKIFLVDSGQS